VNNFNYLRYCNQNYLGQTTQPPNYSCHLNNTTAEFTWVNSLFSHSTLNITANCSLSQCSSNTQGCRVVQTFCFDYRTQNNHSYCAPASDCSLLTPCQNTCSSNEYVCVVNTCCEPKTRCLPLAFTTFCPQISNLFLTIYKKICNISIHYR